MKEIKDLNDLLCYEVQVLYDAERLQIAVLARIITKTNNSELKTVFQQHLEETQRHMQELEKIAELLNIQATGDSNPSIKGLIAEGEKVMHKDVSPAALDAALIATCQKIEHYEIASYGTATWLAEELGLTTIAEVLLGILQEEKEADERLNDLARTRINPKAEVAKEF